MSANVFRMPRKPSPASAYMTTVTLPREQFDDLLEHSASCRDGGAWGCRSREPNSGGVDIYFAAARTGVHSD